MKLEWGETTDDGLNAWLLPGTLILEVILAYRVIRYGKAHILLDINGLNVKLKESTVFLWSLLLYIKLNKTTVNYPQWGSL